MAVSHTRQPAQINQIMPSSPPVAPQAPRKIELNLKTYRKTCVNNLLRNLNTLKSKNNKFDIAKIEEEIKKRLQTRITDIAKKRLNRRLMNLKALKHHLQHNHGAKIIAILGWGNHASKDSATHSKGISDYDTFFIQKSDGSIVSYQLDSSIEFQDENGNFKLTINKKYPSDKHTIDSPGVDQSAIDQYEYLHKDNFLKFEVPHLEHGHKHPPTEHKPCQGHHSHEHKHPPSEHKPCQGHHSHEHIDHKKHLLERKIDLEAISHKTIETWDQFTYSGQKWSCENDTGNFVKCTENKNNRYFNVSWKKLSQNKVVSGGCNSCKDIAYASSQGADETASATSGNDSDNPDQNSNKLHDLAHEYTPLGEILDKSENSSFGISFISIFSTIAKWLPILGFLACSKMLLETRSEYKEISKINQKTKHKDRMNHFLRLKRAFLTCGVIATSCGSASAIGSQLAASLTYWAILGTTGSVFGLAMTLVSIRSHIKRMSLMQQFSVKLNRINEKSDRVKVLSKIADREIKASKKGIWSSAGMLASITITSITPLFIPVLFVALYFYMRENNRLQRNTRYHHGIQDKLDDKHYINYQYREDIKQKHKVTLLGACKNLYNRRDPNICQNHLSDEKQLNQFLFRHARNMNRYTEISMLGQLYRMDQSEKRLMPHNK